MSKDSNAKIFSIVGGCRRSGRWLVPAKNNMMTLFGRAFIDLREAQTDADELEFTCVSVFANVTFIVPEGAEVRPSGMAVLGSSKCIVPVTDQVCHLPPISVDATTVFGRLRVRTTETDPDDDGDKRRFLRRRRTRARAASAATGREDAPEPLPAVEAPAPAGVDPVDFRAPDRGAPPAVFAEDDDLETDEAFDPGAPIPPFVDDVDDDRSPIADVSVPDTIEGTAADPDDVAGPETDEGERVDEASDVIG